MRKTIWFWLPALLWLAGGCCAHPEIFQKVQGSLETVQSFYEHAVAAGGLAAE